MTSTPDPTDTIAWAEANGNKFSWTSAGDNYEPTRLYRCGIGWTYRRNHGDGFGIILSLESVKLPGAAKAVYIMDDGVTVAPFYVAGWKTDHLILHPFPTNFHRDGSARLRADNGQPVNYSDWMVGPRRAYHLKISPYRDVLNGDAGD